ncbi:MAG: DegV family protein [Chloroflexota bacterium]
MQLVTDRAADLSQEQLNSLTIDLHYLPLTLTLDSKEYISGVDIQPEEFYELLSKSDDMPTTSLPSPDVIETRLRKIVADTGDNDLLLVTISQGLSGTYNAARIAVEAVQKDGINVRLIYSRNLGSAEGWHVDAAARAIMAGWSLDDTATMLSKLSDATNLVFTLPDLKYLIHGGRIGHMKGLIASTLGIKPIIGVSKEDGKYEQRGSVRTFKRAVNKIADSIEKFHPAGTKLRFQPQHALNPEGLEQMKASISKKFDVEFMPVAPIAPVLGAHIGVGLVGGAFAAVDDLPEMP